MRMKGSYTRRLKVSTLEGENIYALITPSLNQVHIEVRFLEVVQKDNPPFARNGVIRFHIERDVYKEVIGKLTDYLESLFLRELDKEVPINEDLYTSIGAKRKSRRTKKPLERRGTYELEGEGDSASVRSGARGDESAESSGEGPGEDVLAESGDPQTGGEDSEGD